jgi:hypothetical protein
MDLPEPGPEEGVLDELFKGMVGAAVGGCSSVRSVVNGPSCCIVLSEIEIIHVHYCGRAWSLMEVGFYL